MRKHIIFGTSCLGLLLHSINTFSASVALSVIVTDLNTNLVLSGWILSVYALVFTIAMPLSGKLSETIGRKTTFLACTALFTGASVLCALAPNIYFLIGARAIQALGGGGFMPVASGIVSDLFPEKRQRYIGLFSSILPIGMVIGPNLGGLLVESFGWRSVFWMNLPLGLILLALAFLLLPPDTRRKRGPAMDFAGAAFLFGILLALMLGLTQLGSAESGVPWLSVGVMFAIGALLVVPFLRWERRAADPMVNLELLSSKPFLAANTYNLLYGATILGVLSLIPLYGVTVYGMSVLQSGVLLTPRSIGMIAASGIVSFSLARWGYRRPILIGTGILITSLTVMAVQTLGVSIMGFALDNSALIFVFVGLLGVSSGICTPASNNACIDLMPDKVATITGLRGMFRQLGSAIGVSISVLVLHVIGDPQRAFFAVFAGAALVMILSIPTIFGMPASAEASPPKRTPAPH